MNGLFSELCWGNVMMAYTKTQKWKKEENKWLPAWVLLYKVAMETEYHFLTTPSKNYRTVAKSIGLSHLTYTKIPVSLSASEK